MQSTEKTKKDPQYDALKSTTHTRNVGSIALATTTTSIVAFLLAPFVLEKLGDNKYGVWALLNTVFGLSGLLDLGLRSSFDQRFTRAWHKRNERYKARTYATGKKITFFLSVTTGFATILIALGMWLSTAEGFAYRSELILVTVAFGIQTSSSFFFFPHNAVINAARRFDIVGQLDILDNLLTAALMFACVSYTDNLGILAVCCFTPKALRFFYVRNIATRIYHPPQGAKPSAKLFAIFFRTGVLRFVSSSSVQIIRQIDTLTIFLICGISLVAPYALGASIAARLLQLQQCYRLTMQGEMMKLAANSRLLDLQSTLLTTTRYVLLLLIPPTLISILYAPEFFSLWISKSPAVLALAPENIYSFLAIYSFCIMACSPLTQALTALEQHASLAKLVAVEAALNLTLSITLGFLLGSIGVAAASAAACCLVHIPGRIALAKNHFPAITLGTLKGSITRPVICVLVFLPVLYYSKTLYSVTTWSSLLAVGSCTCIIWFPIAYAIGLNGKERLVVQKTVLRFGTAEA